MADKIAKITRKGGYRCAPEGHTVVTVPEGEEVTGDVAKWALADKAASAMIKKGAGNAPENKSKTG